MHAMVLNKLRSPLEWTELPERQPINPAQSSGAKASSPPVSPRGKAKRASAIVSVAKPPSRV